MVAHRFRQRSLDIDEAFVDGHRLAVRCDHQGSRLASPEDLEGILLDALDDGRGHPRSPASSGSAREERIMGVSVAPG
jgi:hypothetical protein